MIGVLWGQMSYLVAILNCVAITRSLNETREASSYRGYSYLSTQDKTVQRIICIVTGNIQRAQDGTWIVGGGLVMPCKYVLLGEKEHKKQTRVMLKNAASKLQ